MSQLSKASKICDEIVTKMYVPQLQSTLRRRNLEILFNFKGVTSVYEKSPHEIHDENTRQFIDFCEWELGGGWNADKIEEIFVEQYDEGYRRKIRFHIITDDPSPGKHICGSIEEVHNGIIIYDNNGVPVKVFPTISENHQVYVIKYAR